MLPRVWPALNRLSIHVTFTAIVPGAYPGRPKCAKNVLKWRTFELTGWITGKRLKMMGTCCDAFDKHWILFSYIWHLPRLSHKRTHQGRPKCALGWLQKLTLVPLAIAILLVKTNDTMSASDAGHTTLSDMNLQLTCCTPSCKRCTFRPWTLKLHQLAFMTASRAPLHHSLSSLASAPLWCFELKQRQYEIKGLVSMPIIWRFGGTVRESGVSTIWYWCTTWLNAVFQLIKFQLLTVTWWTWIRTKHIEQSPSNCRQS